MSNVCLFSFLLIPNAFSSIPLSSSSLLAKPIFLFLTPNSHVGGTLSKLAGALFVEPSGKVLPKESLIGVLLHAYNLPSPLFTLPFSSPYIVTSNDNLFNSSSLFSFFIVSFVSGSTTSFYKEISFSCFISEHDTGSSPQSYLIITLSSSFPSSSSAG